MEEPTFIDVNDENDDPATLGLDVDAIMEDLNPKIWASQS